MMKSDWALIALHYQNEVLHARGAIRVGVGETSATRGAIMESAAELLRVARAAGLPVVSVRIAFRADHADVITNCKIFRDVVALRAMVEGSWGAEFVEGLGPAHGEFVVKHTRTNAFFGSPLEEILRAIGARKLIVAGVSTNSVVEATVRHASDAGYQVVVVSDACSAGDPELHAASLRNMAYVADIETLDALKARIASWDRSASPADAISS